MKRFIPILIFLTISSTLSYGQRLEYAGTFAPGEAWIKPAEKNYRQALCLNGLWDFQPVALPPHFREGSDVPELPAITANWEKVPIRIPSPWNVNSFADQNGQGGDFKTYPSYPKHWEDVKMGWLRKKFDVPASFNDRKILLHFEAVAGDAEIIINGKRAGKHLGIFLPFDIDVTEFIIPGKENELLVGIKKASLTDKNGPYGRRRYQGGSFWGQHIAGIWQDVNLIALPKVNVHDVYIKPNVGKDQLLAEVTLHNDQNKTLEFSVNADASKWKSDGTLESTVAFTLPAVKIKVAAHGEAKITLSSLVKGNLQLWSPEHPNLYGLVVKVSQSGKIVDQKYTRFGWREVTLNAGAVQINGNPIVLKGDSWHFMGIPQMTRRYAEAWFKALRDAHLNAVRLHAQPYPSFYLDVADEMGIMVLDETAIWASDGGPKLDDPAYWEDTKNHVAELVLRDRNHPSVFGWSVSNEVMPVIKQVFHNPPGLEDTLIKYYSVWRDVVKKWDSTRAWISADGEEDGTGIFPTYVVHYGGPDGMDRALKSGKPWGVGEDGNAYYGTPEQVSEANGDRSYQSFEGRMEGVAIASYKSLMWQRERAASYRSVFNLVWYGLKPLPLGMKDTTKAPTLEDGVFFTSFKEGAPGVQPERLGPYSTTLNPGYDPSLPLYETWPLFDAIKDAATESAAGAVKWAYKKQSPAILTTVTPVKSVKLIAGQGSMLAADLKRTGVPLAKLDVEKVPDVLFIDGVHPPANDTKGQRSLIDKVLNKGGKVIVWDAAPDQLSTLNTLLPYPLSLTSRTASSFLPVTSNQLTQGLSAADLYFSELRPPEIITHGLAGELAEKSEVLIRAAKTDWLKWNKQPEYAKTAMVVRSEREAVPTGDVLIAKKIGKGELIVTTLPAAPKLAKAEKMIRTILTNAGIPLESGNDEGKPLTKGGDIVRALYSGSFAAEEKLSLDVTKSDNIAKGSKVNSKSWMPVFEENGTFNFSEMRSEGPKDHSVAYLSFWVSSPRNLDDLLIEPNIPKVNLDVVADDSAEVYLNGSKIIGASDFNGDRKAHAASLKLHQGWNHFLIKAIQKDGEWTFSGKLSSSLPEFLNDLTSALEKP